VLRSSADLQFIYDSEFQTEGALTLNAFAENASASQVNETTVCMALLLLTLFGRWLFPAAAADADDDDEGGCFVVVLMAYTVQNPWHGGRCQRCVLYPVTFSPHAAHVQHTCGQKFSSSIQ